MKQIVVVGAGGLGREVVEAIRAVNRQQSSWEIVGFIDDSPDLAGRTVEGVPVLGPLSTLDRVGDAMVVVATGSPSDHYSRRRVVDNLGLPGSRFATIVHPAAVLAPSTEIGPGTVILATAVATATVRIGAHVVVMPGAVFTHDDLVSDYATFGSGARLGGRARIGEGAYIGAGALVREDTTVGAWSVVGMGAVVIGDIPPREVWAGVPARRLRAVGVPDGACDR